LALPLRAKAARFAALEPGELVQALLIRFDLGAGIGWHRDRPVFEHVLAYRSSPGDDAVFGDASPAVSIGCRGSWRRGSIYHSRARRDIEWEHSIAAIE